MKKLVTNLKNRNFRRTFLGIIVIIALLTGYIVWQKTSGRVRIDNSLISTPVITVSLSFWQSVGD
jgi:hypothetical protein